MYKLKLRVGKSGHEAWSSTADTAAATAAVTTSATSSIKLPEASLTSGESRDDDSTLKSARHILALPIPQSQKENQSPIHLHQIPLPFPSFLASRATVAASKDTITSNPKSTSNTARGGKNKQTEPVHDKDGNASAANNEAEKRLETSQPKNDRKVKKPKKTKKSKASKQAYIAHKLNNEDSITISLGALQAILRENNSRLVQDLTYTILAVAGSLTTHRQRKDAEEQWIEQYCGTDSTFVTHSLYSSQTLQRIITNSEQPQNGNLHETTVKTTEISPVLEVPSTSPSSAVQS